MKRRSFLRALAGVPLLPSALAALPAPVAYIAQRKILCRVRVTQEELWGLPALIDDGTYRQTYLGIDRGVQP
jgi:hypothetical protein